MLRRFSVSQYFATFLVALFLSISLLHVTVGSVLSAMTSDQCQGSCAGQQLLLSLDKPQDLPEEKESESEPNIPYYLAFIAAGAAIALALATRASLGRLKWRPPDAYRLYGVYRH